MNDKRKNMQWFGKKVINIVYGLMEIGIMTILQCPQKPFFLWQTTIHPLPLIIVSLRRQIYLVGARADTHFQNTVGPQIAQSQIVWFHYNVINFLVSKGLYSIVKLAWSDWLRPDPISYSGGLARYIFAPAQRFFANFAVVAWHGIFASAEIITTKNKK